MYKNSSLTGHHSQISRVEIDDNLGPRRSNFDFASRKDDRLKKKLLNEEVGRKILTVRQTH